MKLHIYMKSGNVIGQSGIKDYAFKQDGSDIVYFKVEYRKWFKPRTRMLVPSICLNQIEAIVRVD
jgi:hypothetical protein